MQMKYFNLFLVMLNYTRFNYQKRKQLKQIIKFNV